MFVSPPQANTMDTRRGDIVTMIKRYDTEIENMVVSDEELSGVSGDETKKLPKPKQNDWDSDSDGDSTDELPYVINEIIASTASHL